MDRKSFFKLVFGGIAGLLMPKIFQNQSIAKNPIIPVPMLLTKGPISEAYVDFLMSPIPEEIQEQLKLPLGATGADYIAQCAGRKALAGNVGAIREIREAIEGKPMKRIELTSRSAREFTVIYADPRGAK